MTEPGGFSYDPNTKTLIVSSNNAFNLSKNSEWFSRTSIQSISQFAVAGNGKVDISHLHAIVFPHSNLLIRVSGNGHFILNVPDCQLNKVTVEMSGLARCVLNCSIASLTVALGNMSTCEIVQNVGNLNIASIGREATLKVNGAVMPHFTTVKKIKKIKPVEKTKVKPLSLKTKTAKKTQEKEKKKDQKPKKNKSQTKKVVISLV